MTYETNGRTFEISKGGKGWNLYILVDGASEHVDAYPTRKAAKAAADRCNW